MAGTSWPTLTDGQKFKASAVEAKFDWLEGSVIPHSGGVVADGVYDLGTSTARWNNMYGKNLYATDLLLVPSGGVALLPPGTATSVFSIKRSDDGNFGALSIYADELSLYGSGSVLALRVGTDGTLLLRNGVAVNEFSTDVTLGDNSDLAIPTENAVLQYALSKVNQKYNFSNFSPALHNTTTNQLITSVSFVPDTTLSIFDIDVEGFVSFQLSTTSGTPGRVGIIFDLGTPALRLMAERTEDLAINTRFHSLRAHARFTNVSHVNTFTVNLYANKGAVGSTLTPISYGLLISPEIAT